MTLASEVLQEFALAAQLGDRFILFNKDLARDNTGLFLFRKKVHDPHPAADAFLLADEQERERIRQIPRVIPKDPPRIPVKKKKHNKLTPEVRTGILEDRLAGDPVRVIAARYRVAESYAYLICSKEGLTAKRMHACKAEVLDYLRNGVSVKQIAAYCGLSKTCVYSIRDRNRGVIK